MMRFNLIVSSLLSIVMHAAVLLLLPAPSLEPLALPNTPTDTEVVVLDIPEQTAPTLPEPSALAEGRPASSTGVAYDAAKIVPLAREQLEGAIAGINAGVPAPLPLPALQLPALRGSKAVVEPPPPLPLDPAAVTATLLEQSLQSPGIRSGAEPPVGQQEVRLGEKQTPTRLGLPTLDQRLIARTPPETPATRPTLPSPPQFGIQGPIARREPLYRPTLPEVQVQAESEITLKFWVRPDGVVSRVLPERKGDATLEVAAIRYLEGWRFTPLPPHEPQVEQWGTITIRFLLRAR
jgi:TonB family protein